MRFALMIEPQQGLSYDEQLAIVRRAEAAGFESFFRSDHYQSFPGPAGQPTTDAWTVLAGLARDTDRIKLGVLVSPVTFRQTGNLAISFVAAVFTSILLFALGSKYAIALGVVVAIFDLIPLAGATIATVIVATIVVIELGWVRCIIVIGAFIAYQQFENHVLQPLVYGRTVKLSPLAVLCAVLIGAQLAGILGALLAIPIAGSLLAIAREILLYRKETREAELLVREPQPGGVEPT